MEACFHHGIKKIKKVIATFYLIIQTFRLRTSELQDINLEFFLFAITSLHLTILSLSNFWIFSSEFWVYTFKKLW